MSKQVAMARNCLSRLEAAFDDVADLVGIRRLVVCRRHHWSDVDLCLVEPHERRWYTVTLRP